MIIFVFYRKLSKGEENKEEDKDEKNIIIYVQD